MDPITTAATSTEVLTMAYQAGGIFAVLFVLLLAAVFLMQWFRDKRHAESAKAREASQAAQTKAMFDAMRSDMESRDEAAASREERLLSIMTQREQDAQRRDAEMMDVQRDLVKALQQTEDSHRAIVAILARIESKTDACNELGDKRRARLAHTGV